MDLRVRFNTNGMKIELNDDNHTVYELKDPIDIYSYSKQITDISFSKISIDFCSKKND